MGLGADKLVKQSTAKPAVDKEGKVLTCRKGAFVKVNAGLHKANYGQVRPLNLPRAFFPYVFITFR